ncbi:LysM peptidoglycan-binding domain-containing protein [Bacillota bacterium Lsc_1132]
MNREDPYRNQAERLRQRIEKVQESKQQASGLPPRSDLHRQRHNRKKTKWKLKYPVIRLLVLFFILLPVVSFSVYSYLDGVKNRGAVKTSVDSQGYETINFEKAKPEKKQKNQKDGARKPANQQDQSTNNAEKNQVTPNENPLPNSSISPSSLNLNGSDKNGNGPETAPSSKTSIRTDSNSKKLVYHTVQPQETIYRIAMNYYHSKEGVTIIKEANKMQSNSIVKGQVLKIPLDQ